MEPVGFTIALLGAAEQCLKVGKELVARYQAYKKAPEDISEQVLILQNHWFRIEGHIEEVQRVSESLGGPLRLHYANVFTRIEANLQEATTLLNGVIRPVNETEAIAHHFHFHVRLKDDKFRRVPFVLSVKGNLEKVMANLKMWSEFLELSRGLLTRSPNGPNQDLKRAVTAEAPTEANPSSAANPIRDEGSPQESRPSIFVPSDFLSSYRHAIRYSESQLSKEQETGREVVIDTMICDPPIKNDDYLGKIRDLAKGLSNGGLARPGMLSCRGLIKTEDSSGRVKQINFIFSIPYGIGHPRSLRQLLMMGDQSYPLDQRLDLGKQLATSVMYLHTARFVHKNVRPETILVFSKKRTVLGSARLVGFERFRPVDGKSAMTGDDCWYKDIYRHPSRQGEHPEDEYIMQHDIYSLGICLLEIGVWAALLSWDETGKVVSLGPGFDLISHLHDDSAKEEALQLKQVLTRLASENDESATQQEDTDMLKDWRKRAYALKRLFVAMAADILPSRMGHKYAEITQSCLTCLDEGNLDFGDEQALKDDDGLLVGTRYMETISFQLQEISM